MSTLVGYLMSNLVNKHTHTQYIYIYIYIYIGGTCSIMVTIIGNGHSELSTNPGQDCISHSTNTHGKVMNATFLWPPAMGK